MSFKKIFVSLLLIAATSQIISAQPVTRDSVNTQDVESENYVPQSEFRPFRLGIYGGLGSSWMKTKTSDVESEGTVFSYQYGLIVDINFTENYAFSSGFNINSMGGKLTDSLYFDANNTYFTHEKYRINSLQIPTSLKLKTNQMGYFTHFAQIGLLHDFRLSAYNDIQYTNNQNEPVSKEDVDYKEYTSFYRIAFQMSLGTEYALSKSLSAFAFISFENGLSNAFNKEKAKISYNSEAEINKLNLTVGLLF